MSETQKDNILSLNSELEQDDYKVYYVDNSNKNDDINNTYTAEKGLEMTSKEFLD